MMVRGVKRTHRARPNALRAPNKIYVAKVSKILSASSRPIVRQRVKHSGEKKKICRVLRTLNYARPKSERYTLPDRLIAVEGRAPRCNSVTRRRAFRLYESTILINLQR